MSSIQDKITNTVYEILLASGDGSEENRVEFKEEEEEVRKPNRSVS